MAITISAPRLSDAPMMAKWGKDNETLRDSEDDEWYTPSLLREWIADPKDDTILVARDGEKLIGMCLVHGMRGWVYFSSLYIDEEYRGQGIGTRLLTKMMETLKEKHYSGCALLVKESNTEATEFYRKQGFKTGYLFRWMGKKL